MASVIWKSLPDNLKTVKKLAESKTYIAVKVIDLRNNINYYVGIPELDYNLGDEFPPNLKLVNGFSDQFISLISNKEILYFNIQKI